MERSELQYVSSMRLNHEQNDEKELFLVNLFLAIIFFSCGDLSGLSDTVVENLLLDMTTKIDASGSVIPDEILGFSIGMSRAEAYREAKKRKMRKTRELRGKIYFKNAVFFGFAINYIKLRLKKGAIEDITLSLKPVNQVTFDCAVERLKEHFGDPTLTIQEDLMARKEWSYSSSHYFYINLDLAPGDPFNSLLAVYVKQ